MGDSQICSDMERDDEVLEDAKRNDVSSCGVSRQNRHDTRDKVMENLAKDAVHAIQRNFPEKEPSSVDSLQPPSPMSPRSFFRAVGVDDSATARCSRRDECERGVFRVSSKTSDNRVGQILKSTKVPVLVFKKRKECDTPLRKNFSSTGVVCKIPQMSQIEEDEDDGIGENDVQNDIQNDVENRPFDINPTLHTCATPEQSLLHKKKRVRLEESSCVTPSTAQAARTLLALMR